MKKSQNYKRYNTGIEHLYERLDKFIQNGIFQNKSIYMFGCSRVAGIIICYLKSRKIELKGIIDNNPKCIGNTILGLNIFSPNSLAEIWNDNTLVLISSGYRDSMIQQLKKMGYIYGKHIIEVFDIQKEAEDYSFVDRTGYIPLSNKEIRKSQLAILCCVKKICKQYNLRYYLAYGTLLGAVRHKGFIPWDDDIDIYIPISDLKQFVTAVKEENAFDIISSINKEDDYYHTVSLMYDCNNVYDTYHFPMQVSTAGITIDIFPLFGLPDSKDEITKYTWELKAAEWDMMYKICNKNAAKLAANNLFTLMEKYNINTAKYVGNLLGPYQSKEILEAKWFTNTTTLEFEGEQFCVPAGFDSYLHTVYGDYMTLPPEEKRKGHHSFHAYHKKN